MNNHPHLPVVSSQNRGAFKIALLYLLIGSLWILFSGQDRSQHLTTWNGNQ